MAGRLDAHGPPPPPPEGFIGGGGGRPAPGIVVVEDFGDHSQGKFPGPRMMPIRQKSYPMQPMPQRQPAFRQNTMINNSIRVSDITPERSLSEDFCRKRLSTIEVYTLRKDEQREIKDYEKPRRNSWGSKDSKSSRKPKTTWQRVTISQDSYSQEDIVRKVRSLDRRGRSVTDKNARLFPNQQAQITKLVDEKAFEEPDPQNFEWTLAQLERRELITQSGKRETAAITIYLKRAPRTQVDVVELFRACDRARQQSQRPMIHQNGNPGNGQGSMKMNGGQGQSHTKPDKNGGGKFNTAGILMPKDNKDRSQSRPRSIKSMSPMKGKAKKGRGYHTDDSSLDSSSDSRSDTDESYDSETGPSSLSSGRRGTRNRGYRQHERPHRHQDRSYLMIDAPRRRSSVAYAPDVPRRGSRVQSYERTSRAGSMADPIAEAEAFAAGMLAGARVSERMSPPSPKTIITYPDRQLEDELRWREDQRRDELRRLEVEDMLNREALPSPRRLPTEYLRRGSLSTLPLDIGRRFEYRRNPFAPSERSF